MPPGFQAVETELADLLGISRTPVREAIIRLCEEGLVEVQGGQFLGGKPRVPQSSGDVAPRRRVAQRILAHRCRRGTRLDRRCDGLGGRPPALPARTEAPELDQRPDRDVEGAAGRAADALGLNVLERINAPAEQASYRAEAQKIFDLEPDVEQRRCASGDLLFVVVVLVLTVVAVLVVRAAGLRFLGRNVFDVNRRDVLGTFYVGEIEQIGNL